MSVTQNEKAARFRALHDGPVAFVIPNPSDAGSARVVAGLGFRALATSSAASACALGRRDGDLTRDEALAHAHRMLDATDLPVSTDLEKGFGDALEIVARNNSRGGNPLLVMSRLCTGAGPGGKAVSGRLLAQGDLIKNL